MTVTMKTTEANGAGTVHTVLLIHQGIRRKHRVPGKSSQNYRGKTFNLPFDTIRFTVNGIRTAKHLSIVNITTSHPLIDPKKI